MTKRLSDRIMSALEKYYGDVKPDLRYGSRYQMTVAVVLSAQTTDRQVNSVTGALFKKYPDFERLARAKTPDVEKIIHSVGFFRIKSKNIIRMAKIVVDRHSGRLPGTREELTALPGIGRKSANIILSMGFGIPAFAVDTHIIRIARRLGYAAARDPRAVERAFTALIPEEKWATAHLLLIRHGRATCRARKPICGSCPVNVWCGSPDKTC